MTRIVIGGASLLFFACGRPCTPSHTFDGGAGACEEHITTCTSSGLAWYVPSQEVDVDVVCSAATCTCSENGVEKKSFANIGYCAKPHADDLFCGEF